MNVPGRKNSVTQVMILMDTVSVLVFLAMMCISLVISSIRIAELCAFSAYSLLASVLRYCKMPVNCR